MEEKGFSINLKCVKECSPCYHKRHLIWHFGLPKELKIPKNLEPRPFIKSLFARTLFTSI